MASFAALATVNFTTVLAGMLIVSPVAGLRPMRLAVYQLQLPNTWERKSTGRFGARDSQVSQVGQQVGCLLLRETVRLSYSCGGL